MQIVTFTLEAKLNVYKIEVASTDRLTDREISYAHWKKVPSFSTEQMGTWSGLALMDLQYAFYRLKLTIRAHGICGGGDVVPIAYRKQPESSHSFFSRRQFNFAALLL